MGATHSGEPWKTAYPEWFVRPPTAAGSLSAVGYSPIYGDSAYSLKVASTDAKAALRTAMGVRVRAEFLLETVATGSVSYRGQSYNEDPLFAEPNVASADTVWRPGMVMMFASTLSMSVPNRIVMMSPNAPDWVSRTPDADGSGIYAVGASNAYFEEYESWREAERDARRTLAYDAVSKQQTMTQRSERALVNATVSSTSADLRGVQVIERWRDARRVFVLVRVARRDRADVSKD